MSEEKKKNTARDKITPRNNGKYARRKGHNYERKLADEFRELGYRYCKTSRQASRLLDDCKVDLYLPDINIQAKAVNGNINYLEVFSSMYKALMENMPERAEFLYALFHKRKGSEIVVMKKKDFYNLLKIKMGNDAKSRVEK